VEPELLTTSEAAKYLGMSRAWFYTRLINTGEVPALHLGSAVRIRRRDLQNWIERLSTASSTAVTVEPAPQR
jgi:excisionase family DNA binding protein